MKEINIYLEDDYYEEIKEIMEKNDITWEEMIDKSIFMFIMVYGYKKSYEFASNSYDMQSVVNL